MSADEGLLSLCPPTPACAITGADVYSVHSLESERAILVLGDVCIWNIEWPTTCEGGGEVCSPGEIEPPRSVCDTLLVALAVLVGGWFWGVRDLEGETSKTEDELVSVLSRSAMSSSRTRFSISIILDDLCVVPAVEELSLPVPAASSYSFNLAANRLVCVGEAIAYESYEAVDTLRLSAGRPEELSRLLLPLLCFRL